jgi:two-component system, cell cycle sensor histidine kinase DivJ
VKPSQPIGDYLDALVHPSARSDALVAARHRAFIAPRVIASLGALAALPVFLALRGVPSALEFIVLIWTIVPIATACYLSRTGRYESAHLISALALAAIATIVAGSTGGGINSIAAIWLVLIPLEAAVSGSRRVVGAAAAVSLGGAGLLLLADPAADAAVSVYHARALAGLGIVSALLYATGIALGAERITRANARLLAAQDDRTRFLAGNMTDVITRLGSDGRVMFASANAQAVLGIAAGDLQGLGLFDRIHVGDRVTFLKALSEAAADAVSRTVEFRILRAKLDDADGCLAWIEMRCRPAPERPNGFAGREVVAVLHEISVQKAQQQALIDARAEAERGNAAKNQFLAVMSHELRTPLNAVIGFSEMLTNAEGLRIDGERRHEYARLINEAGSHLLAVVNGILDVSRLETGDFQITPEPVKPAAVIEGCRDLLALKARDQGVALYCKVPDELPEIIADKRAVRQILLNLVSNALKFTNRGGAVTMGAVVDAEHLVISVADTGIGIAPEHFGQLGDPFFQVRGSYARTHDGAGLGLSIVKGLVKLHGGEVDVRSRVGEGTRVTVRLPLDCECPRGSEPIRKIGRPGDPQYPTMPSFLATTETRFKASMKKSA